MIVRTMPKRKNVQTSLGILFVAEAGHSLEIYLLIVNYV